MKKLLFKTLLVALLVNIVALPSFSTTSKHSQTVLRSPQPLGIINQGNYSVAIYGDLDTGEIISVSVRNIATGWDYGIAGWDGSVSGTITAPYVNAKIYLDEGGLVRLSGILH